MRKLLPLLLLAAACGGKTKPVVAPPSNEGDGTTDVADTYGGEGGDEWSEYGGAGYGEGGYGGGAYGGYGYGGYDQPYVPPAPQPPNIVGTWVAACKAGMGKGEFDTFTFTNTDAKWDLVIATYGDDKCTKRKSAIHLAGSYTFGAQSTAVTTAWEGNFTFEASDLTADDAKTAKALGKLCGIKKMKAGKAVDIHAKGCPKMGFKPAAECANDYDLVALEGDVLRFGVRPADNDMCTPEKRPTALDTSADNVFQYAPTGIPECDTMVDGWKKYMHCATLPVEARNSVFESFRLMMPTISGMGASMCQQYTDGIQQGLSAMGC